jgi:hypothetical protein
MQYQRGDNQIEKSTFNIFSFKFWFLHYLLNIFILIGDKINLYTKYITAHNSKLSFIFYLKL